MIRKKDLINRMINFKLFGNKIGKKSLTYAFELIDQKWKEIQSISSLNVDRIRQIKCLGSKDQANDK